MKWTAIILAAIVCGCHWYSEKEMQEAVQKAKEQTIRDARIGLNCLACGRSLQYWHNCGGGGDWDVRDAEAEIDRIVIECRKRINEVNKRLDEKFRKRAEKKGSKYEGAWFYAPREFTDAEKPRSKCASWTNWTSRIEWHPTHIYCTENPYRDNVEISPYALVYRQEIVDDAIRFYRHKEMS